MTEHQSSRTLLKSAPELWAECSDAASLTRHLGAFGEIHITKLEPETAVAWEGAAASGTVRLESSGWGTRVILTVSGEAAAADAAAPEPEAAIARAPTTEPAPPADWGTAEPRRPGLLARMMLSFRRKPPAAEPEPEPSPPAPDLHDATTPEPPRAEEALVAALDSLGRAHHRPYSRA